MKGNACINHPDKDIKEIPPGTRFCERCRNLVPLEWKPIPKPVPEIVQEMALEEESEPIDKEALADEITEKNLTETMGELMKSGVSVIAIEELAKKVTEQPVEAESKPLDEMSKAELLTTIKEREIDAAAEITALEAEPEPLGTIELTEAETAEALRKAQITALYAKLAELEK